MLIIQNEDDVIDLLTSTVRSRSQMQWPTHKPYVWVIASGHHPIAYGKSYKSTCEITINESFHKLTEICFCSKRTRLKYLMTQKNIQIRFIPQQIVCLENRSVEFRTRDSQTKYGRYQEPPQKACERYIFHVMAYAFF